MMQPCNQLLNKLVLAQERIIGPVAWDVARRVPGLAVDSHHHEIAAVQPQTAPLLLLQLIGQYQKLYGEAARAICRQVVIMVFAPEPVTTVVAQYVSHDTPLCVLTLLDTATQFELVDAIIMDVTSVTTLDNNEFIFKVIAQANLSKRPLLCLYQSNQPPQQLLQFLKKSYLPKRLVIKPYTITNQIALIEQFLNMATAVFNTPQVKFTLRLTPKLNDYLNWLAQHKKINKADYMRQILQKKMMNDNEFLEN